MKITKRQLKRIIREEKEKLVNEGQTVGLPYKQQDALDQLSYRFSEEINAAMGQHDRNWYENPDVMNAIQAMLDDLKSQFRAFTTN